MITQTGDKGRNLSRAARNKSARAAKAITLFTWCALFVATNAHAQLKSSPSVFPALTAERFAKASGTERLLGILFKLEPKRLEDAAAFSYWISMNDRTIAQKCGDEFIWPDVHAHYRRTVDAILAALPATFELAMDVKLLDYDRTTGSFGVAYSDDGRRVSGFSLGNQNQKTPICSKNSKPPFEFVIPPMSVRLTEHLPDRVTVKEEYARDFATQRPDRRATVYVTLLLSSPKTMADEKDFDGIPTIAFSGKVDRALVTAGFSQMGQPVQQAILGELVSSATAHPVKRRGDYFNYRPIFATR